MSLAGSFSLPARFPALSHPPSWGAGCALPPCLPPPPSGRWRARARAPAIRPAGLRPPPLGAVLASSGRAGGRAVGRRLASLAADRPRMAAPLASQLDLAHGSVLTLHQFCIKSAYIQYYLYICKKITFVNILV